MLLSGCSLIDEQDDNTMEMKSVIDDVGSICECSYGTQKNKKTKDTVTPRFIR